MEEILMNIGLIDSVTGEVTRVHTQCQVAYGKGWGIRLANEDLDDIGTLVVENGIAKVVQI